MTVAELIEKLKAFPQDSQVLLSRDEEGNGFGALADIDSSCRCEPDGHGFSLIHPDDNDEDDPRGDLCVVLWP